MAQSHLLSKSLGSSSQDDEQESHQRAYQRYRDLLAPLPSFDGCCSRQLYFHSGWFGTAPILIGTMAAQEFFKARPTDIVLATFPKSGTTWVKALLFATVNRRSTDSDLLRLFSTLNPHQYVPFFEIQLYAKDCVPQLDSLPSPRLFSTHLPLHSLPRSIVESGCRIIYLCRNPKDTFISLWHFVNKIRMNSGREPHPLEVDFNRFCNGLTFFGPYWDHVLGYWTASLEIDKYKILFMRYEEIVHDPIAELKRLAVFIGLPFTADEEKEGGIESILQLCEFKNLSTLEVNKVGTMEMADGALDNNVLFRHGVVGDWTNHLSPEMVQRLDEITETKFRGSGLTF